MLKMNHKMYKCCAVPQCRSTSISTPSKLFVYVPHKKKMRDKWLKLADRDPACLSTSSPLYFCEDHFDLPNDMENYMQYHVMGSVSQVRMKPGCLPTRFQKKCQKGKKARKCKTTKPKIAVEKDVDDCEKQLENCMDYKEIASESSGQLNFEDVQEITSKTIEKTNQVCRVCLAIDVKMYAISEHELSSMYERVTGIEISTEDKLPRQLCWECVGRLSSANRFVAKALKAHWILLNEVNSGRLITVTEIESIDKAQHKLESSLGTKIHNVNTYDLLFTEEICEPNICCTNSESHNQNNEYVSGEESICKEETIFIKEEFTSEEDPVQTEVLNFNASIDVTIKGEERDDSSSSYKDAGLDDEVGDTESNEELAITVKLENINEQEVTGDGETPRKVIDAMPSSSQEPVSIAQTTDTESNDDPLLTEKIRLQEKNTPEIPKNTDVIKPTIHLLEINGNFKLNDSNSLENLFICDICNKPFLKKSTLRRHIKQHPRVYQCTNCSYKTRDRSNFVRHVNTKHVNNTVFQCKQCSYKSYRRGHLRLHVNFMHARRLNDD